MGWNTVTEALIYLRGYFHPPPGWMMFLHSILPRRSGGREKTHSLTFPPPLYGMRRIWRPLFVVVEIEAGKRTLLGCGHPPPPPPSPSLRPHFRGRDRGGGGRGNPSVRPETRARRPFPYPPILPKALQTKEPYLAPVPPPFFPTGTPFAWLLFEMATPGGSGVACKTTPAITKVPSPGGNLKAVAAKFLWNLTERY